MQCPKCLDGVTKVIDTRKTANNEIRRRRECGSCSERFTTYERLESPSLEVTKQDGRQESFEREKLRSGIERACNKRPIDPEKIQAMVDRIEAQIRREADDETVSSTVIGELVEEELKDIDKVAYMRFASVYRSFDDVDSFEEEIEQLKQDEAA
jgi:transcriptional repressor NrdR